MLPSQNNLQRHTYCWDALKECSTGKNKHQIVYFSTDAVWSSHCLSPSAHLTEKKTHVDHHTHSAHPSGYFPPCHSPRPLPLSDSKLYKYPTLCIAGIQKLTCADRGYSGEKTPATERETIERLEYTSGGDTLYCTEDKQLHPCRFSETRLDSNMWLQVCFLCLSCLTVPSQSQAQASLRRANDPAGRCHYTFTVASPEESSCTGSSPNPETDGVLSRLTLLEALVSRLIAREDGGAEAGVGANGEEALQEAYTQVTGERNQLQQDKESLNRQVLELQKRLDELSQEAESLRQRPCKQAPTSGGTQRENRPASGM